MPLAEDSKPYTSFATDQGLFRFTVLPFGLCNAPATFNRLMRIVLGRMEGVHHFLDDILICSDTWVQHLNILREVLVKLQQAGLTAKPSKCHLGMETLEYLGHVLGRDCLGPMSSLVEKIQDAPRPRTKKELRSFLGLSGYYRKFIPHYATLATPLTDLTKKNTPNQLVWTQDQERAFQTLKDLMSKEPILLLPDVTQEFILCTDASSVGLGAVLLQEQQDYMKPIAYVSRKLLPREKRYAVVEKECLAIVWGIKKFSTYLYGVPFVLETDHKPLAYLHQSKHLNPRLMRWALMLQPYEIHIKVIKGSSNVGADYLSRAGHEDQNKEN